MFRKSNPIASPKTYIPISKGLYDKLKTQIEISKYSPATTVRFTSPFVVVLDDRNEEVSRVRLKLDSSRGFSSLFVWVESIDGASHFYDLDPSETDSVASILSQFYICGEVDVEFPVREPSDSSPPDTPPIPKWAFV